MDRTLIDLKTILQETQLTSGLGSNQKQLINNGQLRVLNLWKKFDKFCGDLLEELEKGSKNDTEVSLDNLITKFTDLAHVLSYLSYLRSNSWATSSSVKPLIAPLAKNVPLLIFRFSKMLETHYNKIHDDVRRFLNFPGTEPIVQNFNQWIHYGSIEFLIHHEDFEGQIAFLESLFVCRKRSEYWPKISAFCGEQHPSYDPQSDSNAQKNQNEKDSDLDNVHQRQIKTEENFQKLLEILIKNQQNVQSTSCHQNDTSPQTTGSTPMVVTTLCQNLTETLSIQGLEHDVNNYTLKGDRVYDGALHKLSYLMYHMIHIVQHHFNNPRQILKILRGSISPDKQKKLDNMQPFLDKKLSQVDLFMKSEIKSCPRRLLLKQIIQDFSCRVKNAGLDLFEFKQDQITYGEMVKSFVDSMSFCGGLQEVNNFAFLSNVIEKQLETHDSSGGKIIRKWENFVAKRDIFVNTVWEWNTAPDNTFRAYHTLGRQYPHYGPVQSDDDNSHLRTIPHNYTDKYEWVNFDIRIFSDWLQNELIPDFVCKGAKQFDHSSRNVNVNTFDSTHSYPRNPSYSIKGGASGPTHQTEYYPPPHNSHSYKNQPPQNINPRKPHFKLGFDSSCEKRYDIPKFLANEKSYMNGLTPIWEDPSLQHANNETLHLSAKKFGACMICGLPRHQGKCLKFPTGYPCQHNHVNKAACKYHNQRFHIPVEKYKEFTKNNLRIINCNHERKITPGNNKLFRHHNVYLCENELKDAYNGEIIDLSKIQTCENGYFENQTYAPKPRSFQNSEVSVVNNVNPEFNDSDWEYDYTGDYPDFVNEYWNEF